MSGGSFDYLYVHYEVELRHERQLEQMADRLAVLGYADDAAQETRRALEDARAARVRAEVALKRLEGVWKAMEWWQSSDWSEDAVAEALVKYRGGG